METLGDTQKGWVMDSEPTDATSTALTVMVVSTLMLDIQQVTPVSGQEDSNDTEVVSSEDKLSSPELPNTR